MTVATNALDFIGQYLPIFCAQSSILNVQWLVDRMTLKKIFQRNQRAVAVPKCHMLDVGYEHKLASGNKLRKSPCRCHRSAAAAINVILRAAKNQRRYFYFRRVAKGVPG